MYVFESRKYSTVVMVLVMLLAMAEGCGKRSPQLSNSTSFEENGGLNQTGGFTPENRPYLAVSPEAEVQRIKEGVDTTEDNKAFGAPIGQTYVTVDPIDGVKIEIEDSELPTPLVFKGTLNQNVGEFVEASGQRPDLKLEVSCVDESCNHTNLILKDDNNHKAAIITKKEDRIQNTEIPADEKADDLRDLNIDNSAQGTLVEYYSTEVFPGKTLVAVRTKSDKPQTIFKTVVHETDNDETISAELGGQKNAGATASLEGINSDVAVFKVTPKTKQKKSTDEEPVVYYKYSSPVNPEIAKDCPVHVSGQTHPLVAKLLKEDCGDSRLNPYINRWTKTGSKYTLTSFLKLYEQSKIVKSPSQAMDFKIAAETLRRNNLPTVFTATPLIESTFDWRKTGGDGEIGLWQFMPATARSLHISLSEARQVGPSTQAAANYYKGFLNQYDNNLKLALASYNAPSFVQSAFTSRHGYTRDFWTICSLTTNVSLKNKTCKYVPNILTVMITSLDPAAFGMSNLGAMDAK